MALKRSHERAQEAKDKLLAKYREAKESYGSMKKTRRRATLESLTPEDSPEVPRKPHKEGLISQERERKNNL
jgi:hypothetical protein